MEDGGERGEGDGVKYVNEACYTKKMQTENDMYNVAGARQRQHMGWVSTFGAGMQ